MRGDRAEVPRGEAQASHSWIIPAAKTQSRANEVSLQRRTCRCRAHKLARRGGGEAISLHIFIGDAPDRPARSGKEEFFDGHSKNVDSKKIWDVVIALDE